MYYQLKQTTRYITDIHRYLVYKDITKYIGVEIPKDHIAIIDTEYNLRILPKSSFKRIYGHKKFINKPKRSLYELRNK